MALNFKNLQFFITKISKAQLQTFKSAVTQLFTYLKEEVKDNPVYNEYENARLKWKEWPDDIPQSFGPSSWILPETLDDAKSLSYDIYKTISENDANYAMNFASSLFYGNTTSDDIQQLNSTFIEYFGQALEEIYNANPEIENSTPQKTNNTTVFIIHGHDNELKTEVQLLLHRAGVNNIVLHEQADKGRSIIDKLVEETSVAGYAVALLTPDDLTKNGSSRARQNVILEIGYFLGKLGKERIRMLIKENVEIPSDLSGILYEKHDKNNAWKMKLLKELQAVGIFVDIQAVVNVL